MLRQIRFNVTPFLLVCFTFFGWSSFIQATTSRITEFKHKCQEVARDKNVHFKVRDFTFSNSQFLVKLEAASIWSYSQPMYLRALCFVDRKPELVLISKHYITEYETVKIDELDKNSQSRIINNELYKLQR